MCMPGNAGVEKDADWRGWDGPGTGEAGAGKLVNVGDCAWPFAGLTLCFFLLSCARRPSVNARGARLQCTR